ncbi:MAG: cytochrome c oxidase subunit II [Thermogutta sp.]|nr:cytochrome c oxidase subunit II [Thermogutta sp.]
MKREALSHNDTRGGDTRGGADRRAASAAQAARAVPASRGSEACDLRRQTGLFAWGLPLAQAGGSFWLPDPASTTAHYTDYLFYAIFYISAFFFALIVVLMTVFLILYRRRDSRSKADKAPSHSTVLELFWTFVPVCIVIYIFAAGFIGYMEMRTAPPDAYEIRVTGQKWKWFFTYPTGYVDENLHVPIDRPVRLVMTSRDVIHSLFIPAFRLKMDLVPGRYTSTWFHAVRPGEYPLLCAEYCGDNHSSMLAEVVVHEPGRFEKWLEEASNFMKNLSPVEAGRILYQRQGCAQCHSLDGTRKVGPSFKNAYGEPVRFADGTTAVADENYLRESILVPDAKIVAGYPPQMPPYQGLLDEDKIAALIAFIKSLSDAHADEATPPADADEAPAPDASP